MSGPFLWPCLLIHLSVPKKFLKVLTGTRQGRFICGAVKNFLNMVISTNIQSRYVDFQKAYQMILGNVYKTLYNIKARCRAEQESGDVAAVLQKRERSDVSQDESLLTRIEREVLATWKTKQEKLAVLEMRVEEIVFIMKDLGKAHSIAEDP